MRTLQDPRLITVRTLDREIDRDWWFSMEVLEELRDVLVRIHDQTVDQRYVDFAALAARLEECIEKVQELPDKRA